MAHPKAGANGNDQSRIKSLMEAGKNSTFIAARLNIKQEVVKGFMKTFKAETEAANKKA